MSEGAAEADDQVAVPAGSKRRRVLKRVGLVALALLLVVALTLTYAYRKLNGNLTTGDYEDSFVEPRPTEEAVEGDPRVEGVPSTKGSL